MKNLRIIVYWGVAIGISTFLLMQMNHYLRLPGGKTWNRVAQTIKKDWKKGDALYFSPSWLSGYAMARHRYVNIIRPDELIASSEIPKKKRVWIVEMWGDQDGPRIPPHFREKAIFQFGNVWVSRIERP